MRLYATIALLLLLGLHAGSAGQEPPLAKLRLDIARQYLEPAPHMALAKYYHDRGERLQAFLLLEYVRRGLFPQEQFDPAFAQAFHPREPFDNSKEAEAKLLQQLAKKPDDAAVATKLADVYISRDDWPRAKEHLAKVIRAKPDDFINVEALAEVLRREGKPDEARKVVEDFLAKHPASAEAFRRKIEPLMKSDPPAAGKLLDQAITKFPTEGGFLFNKAVLLQNENKLKEAEEHFVKAAALAKDSAHVQGWASRFFVKVKEDPAKALEYTLNAYFLDPHFRDSEYAERRIGKLSAAAAEKRVQEAKGAGKPLESLLTDKDPIVVGLTVDRMGEKWEARYAKLLVEVLGHDDEYVRAKALRALGANVDQTFDPQLEALLRDPDLRKRGMAGYLVVKRWGKKGIETVQPWLKDEAQLLRYDAVFALLQNGGEEGRKVVLAYRSQEKHPWLKRFLGTIDKKP